MEQRIVEFVEVLRQNGLKVAISEANDAVRALAEVGVEERDLTGQLAATVADLVADPARRTAMSAAMRGFAQPEAASRIVTRLLELAA